MSFLVKTNEDVNVRSGGSVDLMKYMFLVTLPGITLFSLLGSEYFCLAYRISNP